MGTGTRTTSAATNGQATALVVIDVQNTIVDGPDGATPIHDRDNVLARIGELLAKARTAKTPVLFVQHEHPSFAPLMADTPGWEIHPAVAPQPGEPRIRKRACDAFYGTPLRSELDRLGVTRLILAGCETDFCVDTAARRALSLDYDVVPAADAHTTGTGADGGPLSPAQVIAHHNVVLANFPHPTREIVVLPSVEIAF